MISNRLASIIENYHQKFKDSVYCVVPALHADKLVEFQKALFGDHAYQHNELFNHWLYETRPLNKRFYCVQNEQVVGQQSAINMPLKFGDNVVNAACAVDLRIRPEWKMKGLGVALIAELMHKYDVIIGIGVSDDAYKMFVRQGWLDPGLIDALVKPLDMTGYNDKAPNACFKSRLKYAIGLSLSIISNYYRSILHRMNSTKFKKITCFTHVHEKLVNDIYAPNIIKIIKDKDYFNWRFINFPGKERYEAYELIKNETAAAFFVIKMAIHDTTKVLIISEVHAKKSDLGKVFDKIIRLAIVKKVSKITYSGLDHEVLSVLKSRFFYSRPYGERFLIYLNLPMLESKMMEKRNWKICSADSDTEFELLNSE